MFNIVKVPLSQQPQRREKKEASGFKRMPILYLELLENKFKVKPEFRNKDYVPKVENATTNNNNKSSDDDDTDSSDHHQNNNSAPPPPPPTPSRESPPTQPPPSKSPRSAPAVSSAAREIVEKYGAIGDDTGVSDAPPTLSELKAKDPKFKSDTNGFKYPTADDDEAIKERNDLYFQYEVLKRMHPNAQIPEMTQYSDTKMMAKKYELLTKKLSLDSSVDNWKRYMMVFVLGCEVLLGKLNFDMEGFAQQQMISMNTYDSLLIELAEKNYVPNGSKWPVELRLAGTFLINLAMFIMAKIIEKRYNLNLFSTINQMTSNLNNPSSQQAGAPPPPNSGGGTNIPSGVPSNGGDPMMKLPVSKL